MNDFIQTFNKLYHTDFRYQQSSELELRVALHRAGISQMLVDDRVLAFGTYHECHFPVLKASSTALEQLLQRPTTSLSQYLRREKETWLAALPCADS